MKKHERIQYAIEQSGKPKKDIAKLCQVTAAAITQWTQGPKSMRDENMFALAKATGFRAEWLSLGTGPQKDPAVQRHVEVIGMVAAWDAAEPVANDKVELPYYAEVQIAAGSGMTETVEIADRTLLFSKVTLRAAGVEPSCAAVARVKDRSMEKLILDGAAIGFDMSFKHVVDGEIYAFNQEGMLRVKYLYRLPKGTIRVRSENSAEYPDEILTSEDFSRITVLGRVFWWSTVRRSPRH
ncbi:HTH-type transcriptional regulator PrtR [compost metagenome]